MTLEKDQPINVGDLGFPLNPAALGISVSESDKGAIMAVEGELDLATAPILRDALLDLTEVLEGDLVLDIGLLTFIDSSGLSLLVAEHKKLRARGRELVISSPTPRTRRVFEIAGLLEILTVHPDR